MRIRDATDEDWPAVWRFAEAIFAAGETFSSRAEGYRGMQFNAVAASNTCALRLYESVGMRTLARIPGAFHHPAQGYVDLHLMFLRL